MVERLYLAKAFLLSCLCLLATPVALAQGTDPFQRYLRFHNSLERTIYPVIESPQDAPVRNKDGVLSKPSNCETGGLLRISVNQGVEGAGMARPSGRRVLPRG